MIGPVSGTGRAMMASLQQAIQKGMPPDQAVQYVKSMATQGVAPLADLYAMMNQFQRLKQPQAQAPQTPPTIKDQLNMLDQQQQMQAQAPQPSPMDRGLGAIDAGNMEYPQFAGGGVVALAGGGTAGIDFSKMTTEQLQILAEGEDRELAEQANREYIRRTSRVSAVDYTKKKLGEAFSKMGYTPEYFKQAFYDPSTAINFEMTGGAPAYMKDEKGRIRTPDNGRGVTSSLTEGIVPIPQRPAAPAVTPSQNAVPPAASAAAAPPAAPALGGAAFDQNIAMGRAGVRQDMPPAAIPPATSPFAPPSGAGRAGASQSSPRAAARPAFMSELDEYRGSEGEYVGKKLREQEALDKEFGLGKESEAYKARQRQVDEMTKERGKREEEDRRMDRAEFFFNIAAQAAQPGATFMGSIAKAGPGFAKASRETTSRLRDLQERAQEAQLRLMEAEQLRKEGNVKGAQQAFASGRKQMVDTGIELYKIQKQEEQNIRTTNAMIRQSDPGGLKAIEGDLARQIAAGGGTPQSRLEAILGAGKATTSDVAFRKNLLSSTNKDISDAQKLLTNPVVAYNPQMKAEVEQRLNNAIQMRENLLAQYPDLLEAVGGGGGSGSMGMTGGAGAGGQFTVLGSRPAQ